MITAVIPTSPFKSQPDTSIIDETIASIRHHLDCEIIVTFDGVRKEDKSKRADYQEYIRRVLYKHDIIPYIFDDHQHQVGMMRHLLENDEIKTPLLLYMESDAPLVTDYEIPLKELGERILSGESDLIRFHHEGVVPKEHNHMIIGKVENDLLRTCQWSQRPHLSSVAYYRRILGEHFSPKANSFIEDKMHSVAHQAYERDGLQGWQQHKLHIYHPGGNIKRSYHTDQRDGGAKYDEKQRF